MKFIKRNIVILLIITFVCTAVYLNRSYSKESEAAIKSEEESAEAQTDSGLYYTEENNSGSSDYFDTVRLSRQQARDSAIEILQHTAATETASQSAIDEAVSAISLMAEYSVSEAQIENLLMAKGFEQCVVFIGNDSATVTVSAPMEGLSSSAVSRITDIMLSETDFSADQIKIIEIK